MPLYEFMFEQNESIMVPVISSGFALKRKYVEF